MEIRQLSAEERLTDAFPLLGYAFQSSPESADQIGRHRTRLPYYEGHRTLAAYEGGAARAVASGMPMRQNLRGTVLPMLGVAGVTSHPLARRQGHVRALLHQLLDDARDEGQLVSTLYPFRSAFYARFGYVGLPQGRTASFAPEELAELLRVDLPGEVTLERIGTGFPRYRAFTERLLAERHGFAVLPEYRAAWARDDDQQWLVSAVVNGETVGALSYRIDEHGGTLTGNDLLAADPLGRALLLQFLARHVDQVTRISVRVPADELPELWLTDLAVHTEAKPVRPVRLPPMGRLLSLDALGGLPAGPGRVCVELVGDRYLAGTHLLDGTDGRIAVSPADSGGSSGLPTATLSCAGLSGLAYGVLDPAEVAIRGFGSVPAEAVAPLRQLFPRRLPYLFASF